MDLAHKRRWILGCLGGLGVLVGMAIALAILDRAMSKGLAPIGANIPFEAVQINLQTESLSGDSVEVARESLSLPQKGDRFDLIVQHHAKVASGKQLHATPSLGYILARQNECLILFPSSTHVRGYQTHSIAATIASLYYDLRGGLLLLGHDTKEQQEENQEDSQGEHQGETSTTPINNKNSYLSQPSPFLYLLLDSRWCTQLKVHEGMAIGSDVKD